MAIGMQVVEDKGARAFEIGKKISDCPYRGGACNGLAKRVAKKISRKNAVKD